jgi:GcrA cell cycle regulator
MWTKPIEARLIQAWNDEGRTASEIADLLGAPFTRNATIAKVWRLRRAGIFMRERADLSALATRQREVARMVKQRIRVRPILARPPELPVEPMTTAPDVLTPTIFDTLALTKHSCRWPYGDPKKDGFGYCGRQRTVGKPYCEAHVARSCGVAAERPAAKKAPARELVSA